MSSNWVSLTETEGRFFLFCSTAPQWLESFETNCIGIKILTLEWIVWVMLSILKKTQTNTAKKTLQTSRGVCSLYPMCRHINITFFSGCWKPGRVCTSKSALLSVLFCWGVHRRKVDGGWRNISTRSTWVSHLHLSQAQENLPADQVELGESCRMLVPPSWDVWGSHLMCFSKV